MKVMLVNGSPHEKGCTYTALKEIADTLAREGVDSEIFWLGKEPISGCMACMACRRLGRCAIDDAVNRFLEKAKEADGFIFGTPVHWAGASGALTSFMDRVFYADRGSFYMKPAATVCSARRAGTTATWDQINKYFGLVQMPIVTSQYWNMVHGATPEQVQEDLEGLQTMRTLARNIAWLVESTKALPQPPQEPRVGTNFIR